MATGWLAGYVEPNDAVVRIGGGDPISNLNGNYLAIYLAGTYTVTFERSGYVTKTKTGVVIPENSTNTLADVTLTPLPGTLSGTITRVKRKNPLHYMENASVVVGSMPAVLADANGYYSVTGITPGTYDVTITKDAYDTKVIEDVVIGPGADVTQDAEIEWTDGLAKFVITCDHCGTPIEGVQCAIAGVTPSSDAAGIAKRKVPVGTYTATITHANWDTETVSMTIVKNETTIANVGLTNS